MGDYSKKAKKFLRIVLRAWLLLLVGILVVVALAYREEVPSVLAQSDVERLPDQTSAHVGQKVLVVTPHPDDETIGAGGYIAASVKAGAEVRVVLVTDGNHHGKKEIRHAEFERATAILGVAADELVFLNFPDASLAHGNDTLLRAALEKQISVFQPDVIVYPDRRDSNPDHYTIGRITDLILEAHPGITRYEYLVHFAVLYPRPRKFDVSLYLLPPRSLVTVDRSWSQFPLSQAAEDTKQEAMFAYQSQLAEPWLKGLLLSSVRRNELFSTPAQPASGK
jgi:N-acetylglucosamine malate deacetylase 1